MCSGNNDSSFFSSSVQHQRTRVSLRLNGDTCIWISGRWKNCVVMQHFKIRNLISKQIFRIQVLCALNVGFFLFILSTMFISLTVTHTTYTVMMNVRLCSSFLFFVFPYLRIRLFLSFRFIIFILRFVSSLVIRWKTYVRAWFEPLRTLFISPFCSSTEYWQGRIELATFYFYVRVFRPFSFHCFISFHWIWDTNH